MTRRSALLRLYRAVRCWGIVGVIVLILAGGLILRSSSSAAGISTLGSRRAASLLPAPRNVQVSHGRYQAYGEPSLAVNPTNRRNLLAAAQCINGSALPIPCSFASFDGGATWRENGPLPLPAHDKGGGDVTVAFNPRGTGFIASHAGSSWNVDTVLVWRSDNEGRSFSRPVIVFSGSHGADVVDHPSMAVGATRAGAPAPLYVVWTANGGQAFSARTRLFFSRSDNSGRSFTKPRSIGQVKQGFPGIPIVTAGPNGIVHVLYAVGHRDPYATPFVPLPRIVLSSADGGRHFDRPQSIASEPGFGITFDHMKMANIPAAATDARDGTLYVAMVGYGQRSRHTEILLWCSRNGGRTWAKPLRVNDDPVNDQADHVQPQLFVTRRGAVYVSYFTIRHWYVNLYLIRSMTHGASFGPSRRVTSASFDLRLSGQKRDGSPWIGDYQGLAAGPHKIYPLWNDTRTGRMEIFTAAVATRY